LARRVLCFWLSVIFQSWLVVEMAKSGSCPSEKDRADDLVAAARLLMRNDRNDEARACLELAVAKAPNYVPGLVELGTLASKQQDYSAAVTHLAQGARLEVTPQALNNLAIAYQELGEHVSAVSVYRRALKLDEDDPAAHYNLGTALERAGEYRAAVKAYREAIELEPEEAKYYNNMGGSLAAYNKTETAERSYKWAIKLKPKFVDAYYNLGNLLLATGNVEGAIERLEQALRIDPSHARASAKLQDAQKQLEDKVEAFKGQVDEAIEKAQKMMRRGEL